ATSMSRSSSATWAPNFLETFSSLIRAISSLEPDAERGARIGVEEMNLCRVDPGPDPVAGPVDEAGGGARPEGARAHLEVHDVERTERLDDVGLDRAITGFLLMAQQNALRAHAEREVLARLLVLKHREH